MIIIDSLFSPIRRVAMNIENIRVGKRNDYEKLSLSIETDGTISSLEAFLKAASLLNEEFAFLTREGEKLVEKEKPVVEKPSKKVAKTRKTKKKDKRK